MAIKPLQFFRYNCCFLATIIILGNLPESFAQEKPLIQSGATWKYLDNGTDQGTSWRAIDMDDSEWNSGKTQLGYGDDDEMTEVGFGDNPDNKHITTYFRHSFAVSDPNSYTNLLLRMLRDDGAIVYLNEIEVARSNMPEGNVDYLTIASLPVDGSDENRFYIYPVCSELLRQGNNIVAVEIHQGYPESSDISFDLELVPAIPDRIRLIKGPYLIYPGENTTMTILWQMSAETSCILQWGLSSENLNYTAMTTEYGDDHQHKFTISDLTPGKRYNYHLKAGADEYQGSFKAAPSNNSIDVKFMIYGDTQSYADIHDAVAVQMIETYVNDPAYQTFTLHAGDRVDFGDEELEWANKIFNPNQKNIRQFQANMPINGCKGNHEETGILFKKYWPYPYIDDFYWSFDYGLVHIVILDQYVSYEPASKQYNWLVNDLAETDKKWICILLHEPGWSAGAHDNNTDVQKNIQFLCETYGVDIVFSGHNHYYARANVNNVQHITLGGGGGDLYEPDTSYPYIQCAEKIHHFCKVEIHGNKLIFVANRLDGTEIDNFTLTGSLLSGDLNYDGIVTLADAIIAMQKMAGL